MKILIYSDYYKSKSGYAREIADLIPHFLKEGHEIAQVALGFNGYPIHKEKDVLIYPSEKGDYWAKDVLEYAIKDLPAPDSPANAVILLFATPPLSNFPDNAASNK
jgi:hypothetical protein